MIARLRQPFWLIVCAAAVSVPLFLLLRSPLGPWLKGLAEMVWRLYGVLPSAVLWLGLVLVLYFMMAMGWLALALRRDWRAPWGARPGLAESEGRVAVLTRWIRRRQRGAYSRHYVKQRVSELGVEKLAQAHRASPAQIKAALEAGALGLPPEINAYLLAGLSPWPAEPLTGSRDLAAWLGLKRPAARRDAWETERVLDYLENL
jgi:hypothetical protein